MNELEHLKSIWAPKIRRQTILIVPEVTSKSLHNQHWKFDVLFAFRDALDIQFQRRIKNKKPYWVWTQGPILSFKEGDIIKSRDGKQLVQVQFANPMGWDESKNSMNEGSVMFDEFAVNNDQHTKIRRETCSQMQFLELLIYGACTTQ